MLAVLHDIRSIDVVNGLVGPFDHSLVIHAVESVLHILVNSLVSLPEDRSGLIYVCRKVAPLLMLSVYNIHRIVVKYDPLLDCDVVYIIRRVS